MNLELWTRPNYYIGADWDGYYVFLGRNRDSQLLEVSNFECALSDLGGESETVLVVREYHWAVGWVEWIAIHESDTTALKAADEIVAALAIYPIVNESDYSEREWEYACEAWECMSVRERVRLLGEAGENIFSARSDDLPSSGDVFERLTRGA